MQQTYTTLLGNEVHVSVQFARAEQIGNLAAAVESRVEYTQSPPASDTRVQHGRLNVRAFRLGQAVVMLYLNSQCCVTANSSQLDVCCIGHVEISVEVNCPDTCTHMQHRIGANVLMPTSQCFDSGDRKGNNIFSILFYRPLFAYGDHSRLVPNGSPKEPLGITEY